MSKLMLQMQMSVDGFVADPDGGMDWMVWSYQEEWLWGSDLRRYHLETIASADRVVMSDKMASGGFIDHWATTAKSGNEQARFARHIADVQKVVFSRRPRPSTWDNTTTTSGSLREELTALKSQPDTGNIIAFGGVRFARQLLREQLVDSLHLIINPTVLGRGLRIFDTAGPRGMQLRDVEFHEQEIVVLQYERQHSSPSDSGAAVLDKVQQHRGLSVG